MWLFSLLYYTLTSVPLLLLGGYLLKHGNLTALARTTQQSNPLDRFTRHTLAYKTVWIVGASSGIGRELALQAATCTGVQLILSSRSKDALQQVSDECQQLAARSGQAMKAGASSKPILLPLDVEALGRSEKPEDARQLLQQIHQQLVSDHGIEHGIDVVMLNAGCSVRGSVADTSLAVDHTVMNTNYFGLVALTKAFLHHLQQLDAQGTTQQRHRYVAYTSSIQGLIGNGYRSSYAASKFALHGFVESLRYELKAISAAANNKLSMSLTLCIPGYVNTNLSKNAFTADGRKHGKLDATTAGGMTAPAVAARMWRAVMKQQAHIVIAEPKVHLAVWLYQLLPEVLQRIMQARAVKEGQQLHEQ